MENLQYDGQCAFAVSTGKLGVKDCKHFETIDGKNYAFSNGFAKFLFKLLPNRKEKADEVWNNRNQKEEVRKSA